MSETKNLQNQWYNGTEVIEITAQEYILLKVASEQSLQNFVKVSYPEVRAYVNKDTGVYVEKPTKKQLESEAAVLVVSPEKTFAQENMRVDYDGKITQEILAARELILAIHQRNIEKGITTDIDILEAAFKEAKEASKLEVV